MKDNSSGLKKEEDLIKSKYLVYDDFQILVVMFMIALNEMIHIRTTDFDKFANYLNRLKMIYFAISIRIKLSVR
jgi:hypothetical protein